MLQGYESPSRPPVHCQNGMVATSHALSTEAALDILQAGGNAMDAAIAACVVQCVVEPGSTGVGGDCFCMYAPGGQTSNIVAFNGSGKAPSGATCDFFASQGISEIPRQSPHACVVPGAVDAWCQLNHDHGSLPLKDVLAPAIGFARDGYEVFPRVSRDWASSVELMKAEPSLAQIFLSEGQPPKAGDRHHQPALAQTLEAIAEGGRAAFYTGPIAEDMVNYLRKLGGLHTLADFAATRGEYVTPISGQFRGFDVYQCPPNGQGVIALLLLNIMAEMDSGDDPICADRIHAEIEACRLAYTARNMYVADPAFSDVDVDTLLSAAYAQRLRHAIDPNVARDPMPPRDLVRHKSTVYISVVDKDRNVCSFINTLFENWGAGLCEPKSGVVFTNRAQGFSLDPRSPNCIAPGKRPLHTIIPAMVGHEDRVQLCYGVMGGEYQSMGHMQFLTRYFDYGMNIQDAMNAPRFMANPFTGEVEMEEGVPTCVRDALVTKGHRIVDPQKPIGGSQAVWIDWENGTLTGGSDPRKDGFASGY